MSLPPDQAQKNVAAAQQAQQTAPAFRRQPLPVIFWFMVIAFVALSHFRRGSAVGAIARAHGGISPWVVLWGLNGLAAARAAAGAAAAWGGGGWRRRRRRFGGFSGGGGSFGGGGASGSW